MLGASGLRGPKRSTSFAGMGSTLKLGRDLREMSFAAAVGEIVATGSTGALELHNTLGVSRVYFVDGKPQGGRLPRTKHPIGVLAAERGWMSEVDLNRAIDRQQSSAKLLGQVMLELQLVSQNQLDELLRLQSRRNFYSLFSAREGRLEFLEGRVHLTDFTLAPIPPIAAIYFGLSDAGRSEPVHGTVAPLLTAGLQVADDTPEIVAELPPAERFAVEWMRVPRFSGELARAVPLPEQRVLFLLFALRASRYLRLLPARSLPRSR